MRLQKRWILDILLWGAVILHMCLAFATMNAYASAQGVSFYYFVPILFLYLLIPFFLRKEKSIAVFGLLESLFFAFIPTIDMAMLCRLSDGRNILRVGFHMNESLILMSRFPRELLPILIFLLFLVNKREKQSPVKIVVIVGIAALLAAGMLFLQELSEVCLFLQAYLFILLVYDGFLRLCKEDNGKYDRILQGIFVLLFWLKGCYQMLLILNTYLPM